MLNTRGVRETRPSWIFEYMYIIHGYFKSHTKYVNVLCIISCMQQNSYKDQYALDYYEFACQRMN